MLPHLCLCSVSGTSGLSSEDTCCLVAAQVGFPLPILHLGLLVQDVGQICEVRQVLFVLLHMRAVLSALLVTRNSVALGVPDN